MSAANVIYPGTVNVLASLPTGVIVLMTKDHAELPVDKELLMSGSKFFQDMLSACDAPKIQIDETMETMSTVLEVLQGGAPVGTYDTKNSSCWVSFKDVVCVADKYDMRVVKERCEKMLLSRCLRGRLRNKDYRFQDISLGMEWLLLCQKYALKDLGWYIAFDLGCQLHRYIAFDLGCQLQQRRWSPHLVPDFLRDLQDPDLMKVIIEGAAGDVPGEPSLGGVPSLLGV